MFFRTLICAMLFTCFSASSPKHAIYIAVVEISREAESEEATLMIKVFSSDLQDAVRNFDSAYKPVSLASFVQANAKSIRGYFHQHFKLKINGHLVGSELVETKQDGEVHFLYFTFATKGQWHKLEVKGDFFTELFPDQSNILIITNMDKKYHARLTKANPSYSVIFD